MSYADHKVQNDETNSNNVVNTEEGILGDEKEKKHCVSPLLFCFVSFRCSFNEMRFDI